ncbi:leucine-rich repeat domain-containing protein [Antarctobacter heliothermus]|uniref:Internalin-A n=1 Tax=Antarctobacter heliothermus TaxID=74033 RepID=A0A239CMK6_9RHOB|nr:leucine-rich repeat domain-containing protein [Antarctobacter heliothermus]SNS21360.1 hypothetical protein SAMN04488078_100780 [Antarctobacter heliothermus]
MFRSLSFALAVSAFGAAAQDCVPLGDVCLTPDDTEVRLGPDTLGDLHKLAQTPWVTAVRLKGDGDATRAVDLTPIGDLPSLTYLRVDDLPGARWDTLDQPGIVAIRLKDNGITDFGFLAGMPLLRGLWIKEDLGLSDLPRETLGTVENLRLNGPDLRDLNADGALVNLKILGFGNVSLPDLQGLGPTPALEVLNVEGEQIDSLDGLIVGPAFKDLLAKESSLTDISALAPAENLTTVHAKNSRINDISALRGKTKLLTLFLTGTQVQDLSPVKDMTALQLLSFSDTPVTDISPLAGLPELVAIYMNVTRVTDFTPLLQSRKDIILRINSDQILASGLLPDFIANEGWKRGPLYEN